MPNLRNVRAFRKNLLGWFRQFRRDLPWRGEKDPYRIWISEIMLQQTRVAAAIPYYQRFLERFPSVQSLASAPEEEVLRLWSGLGYYGRARNLRKAAWQIVAQHSGKFPSSKEEALALSGIGEYTAAAILSIAFDEKLAALDGNVARVLARVDAMRGDLQESRRWKKLQKAAEDLLDPEVPGDWNQSMMELGATLCTPKSPQCLICPVAEFCEARKQGIAERLPEKRKKRPTVEVALAAAVFASEKGKTLLLSPPGFSNEESIVDHVPTLVSKMWHFPTISVTGDAGEQLRGHLRKLSPEFCKRKLAFVPAGKVKHAVTYRNITIIPFRIHVRKLPRIRGARAVPLRALSLVPISSLTRKVALAALAAESST